MLNSLQLHLAVLIQELVITMRMLRILYLSGKAIIKSSKIDRIQT